MGIVDWEPRALPSEARCRVWADNSGVFLASDPTGGVRLMPSPGDAREYAFAQCFATEGVRVRPWKNCEPVPWSEFFAATHPPIPEGWEAVGEWFPWGKGSRHPEYDATLTDEGEMIGKSERATKIPMYGCHVRRAPPAIPEGWEAVGPWQFGAASMALTGASMMDHAGAIHPAGVSVRGWCRTVRRVPPPADWPDVPRGVELFRAQTIGFENRLCVVWGGNFYGMVWKLNNTWETKSASGIGGLQASLPAAIVALTGRRE